jgi:hypothetical protein
VEAERKREREREVALGVAWSSAAVCRRRGSGPAAARCRATVEDGEVGATWSTRLIGGPGRDGGRIISG